MIVVIHENKEWMTPFATAFNEQNLDYDFWYLPEMSLDLQQLRHKPSTGIG